MSRLFPLGRTYRWLLVLMSLVSLMPTPGALCDEVKLRSGDVLQGTIVEHTEIHVILEHPDLGKLTIPGDVAVDASAGFLFGKLVLAKALCSVGSET